MHRLNWSDHRKIADFVRDLYGLGSLEAVSERTVQKMGTLIDGNSCAFTLVENKVRAVRALADNLGPEVSKILPAVVAFQHQHPGFRYHLAHPAGNAVAIADLVPLRQWKRTAFFNEVCSKLGMHEQLGASLPFARPDIMTVIINRTRRTFTDRDHTVLDLLRLHLSEVCRTVQTRPAVPVAWTVGALEPFLDGAIVLLDRAGTVAFASERARRHFETFFAAESPFQGVLPPTVQQWVRRELTAWHTDTLAVRPPQALVVRRGETSLQLRLSSVPNGAVHALRVRVEGLTLDLERLNPLGLGPRATQVLYWVAQGKTNEEVAIILEMGAGTVKTHLKGIFARLGVENRASAAATVSRLLAPRGASKLP